MAVDAALSALLRRAEASSRVCKRESSVSVWDAAKIESLSLSEVRSLGSLVDTLGSLSAKAQDIPTPFTSLDSLRRSNQQQRLYVLRDNSSEADAAGAGDDGAVVGFAKVGEKKLWCYDARGMVVEATPLCLLDFYVLESRQRRGYGKRLFDAVLSNEGPGISSPTTMGGEEGEEGVGLCRAASVMAYDRPSAKLRPFLDKYYGLRQQQAIDQPNRFMVFDPHYFDHFGARAMTRER